jgi:hypothetical protein
MMTPAPELSDARPVDRPHETHSTRQAPANCRNSPTCEAAVRGTFSGLLGTYPAPWTLAAPDPAGVEPWRIQIRRRTVSALRTFELWREPLRTRPRTAGSARRQPCPRRCPQ